MKQPLPKHIIFNYLAGRATPLENQRVDEWLNYAENTEQFHRWLMEWEQLSPQYVPDTDAAFARLTRRLLQEVPEDKPLIEAARRPLRRKNWMIAASVTLLLSLAGWLLREPILYKTYHTEFGETSSFVLADGSRVTLNANSSLRVPRFGFDKQNREVRLTGEAAFSVRHTHDHQRFTVKTPNQLQVEVLGTEFTVFARSRGSRVALLEGKIRLDYNQGPQKQQLLIKPGEQVIVKPTGELTVKKTEKPEQLIAWKEQRFVFNNTSVNEICALLRETFGVLVHPGDHETAVRTITGNFKAQNGEDLLTVLQEVLNLKVTQQKSTLLLYNQDTTLKPL